MERYYKKILITSRIQVKDVDGDGVDELVYLPLNNQHIQFLLTENINNIGVLTEYPNLIKEEVETYNWGTNNTGSGDGGNTYNTTTTPTSNLSIDETTISGGTVTPLPGTLGDIQTTGSGIFIDNDDIETDVIEPTPAPDTTPTVTEATPGQPTSSPNPIVPIQSTISVANSSNTTAGD
jgi:hypothetical protein